MPTDFDQTVYLRVREKEKRLYPDELVAHLPYTPEDHPMHSEWQARSASAARLTAYLEQLPRPAGVLDLGCGNGWLSNRLAQVSGITVVGLERNRLELQQACRVFQNPALLWTDSDIFCPPFSDRTFDLVLLASVIQYFPDVGGLILTLARLLRNGGEIHILDSPLYTRDSLESARERTRRYYANLGIPEMASYYHHHSLTALDPFGPVCLYAPSTDERGDSPFPWIRLRI